MSATSTDAASLPPSSYPSPPSPSFSLPSSTPTATPASLFIITPVSGIILSSGLLSLRQAMLEPCTIASSTSTISATITAVTEGSTTPVATSSNTGYTTITVAFTTTTTTPQVVTGPPIAAPTGSNRTNIGATVVGGVVGGVGGFIILAILVVFCLRKRRNEFDGNFDPVHVKIKGGCGGTLPKINLMEGLMGKNGVGVDEDDGMGGRLGDGPGTGGIIMPYSFQAAPMSNIGVGADGVGAASAAGYPNEKRAKLKRKRHWQHYIQHSPNQSISSFYFSSYPNLHLNPNSVSPEPYPTTSYGSSSPHTGGIYYNSYQSKEMGPPLGASMPSPSSGGRNAKKMEAMGRVIFSNPDDGRGQLPAFQEAYLQTGRPHQHQQCLSTSSSKTILSQLPTLSRTDTAVVSDEEAELEGDLGTFKLKH